MARSQNQIPERFREIIHRQREVYNNNATVRESDQIPDTTEIAVKDDADWIKVPAVICVFVDMVGSTMLSASQFDRSTARTYQWFTGTAVRLFAEFGAPYVDVRGDGVFGLFDGDQPNTALASAVTFKTFVENDFVPEITRRTNGKIESGVHIGIDCKTVLVKKVGLPRRNNRSDRQNEVWAGKPVNMASKLCNQCPAGSILVSDRYFELLSDERALKTCGCGSSGEKVDLWTRYEVVEDSPYDFSFYYELKSKWCEIHGEEYCNAIVALDGADGQTR